MSKLGNAEWLSRRQLTLSDLFYLGVLLHSNVVNDLLNLLLFGLCAEPSAASIQSTLAATSTTRRTRSLRTGRETGSRGLARYRGSCATVGRMSMSLRTEGDCSAIDHLAPCRPLKERHKRAFATNAHSIYSEVLSEHAHISLHTVYVHLQETLLVS